MRYLAGYSGEGHLVMGRGWASLIPGHFFAEQAEEECAAAAGLDVVTRHGGGPKAIAAVLKGRSVRRLGIQADYMTAAGQKALAEALGGKKLVPIPSLKDGRRIVKDDAELRAILKAIRIGQKAMTGLIDRGAGGLVGRTEADVAAELEYRMKQLGAERAAFSTVVAAGSHSSRCHHSPGRRKIRRGQPLLIDWGAQIGGYCGDLTRTLFVGKILRKIGEIYQVVLSAQKAGIAAIRPGVVCSTVDAAARKIITDAGYGKEFCHGLGHGLGLDVHESPVLAAGRKTRLRAGMVVTVEPGIYVPGLGGVRIEDDVLVTPAGHRRLSSLPRRIEKMVLT